MDNQSVVWVVVHEELDSRNEASEPVSRVWLFRTEEGAAACAAKLADELGLVPGEHEARLFWDEENTNGTVRWFAEQVSA